jgi:hypothetical protein
MSVESEEISKMKKIENELELIKVLILARGNYLTKQKPVSFRGIAKLLVSEKELLKAIEEAKDSLLKGFKMFYPAHTHA